MNTQYKANLEKRLESTRSKQDVLLQYIYRFYKNKEFRQRELTEKTTFISQPVLRTYLSRFKGEGYLTISKKGKKDWAYSSTPLLAQRVKEISAKRNILNFYKTTLPPTAIRLRGSLRKVHRGFHIEVHSSYLARSARATEIRCKIFRHKKYFVVDPSMEGTKLIPKHRDYSVDTTISKSLVYESELERFQKKKLLPIEVYLTPEEWSMNVEDFFTENPFTRELVKALSKHFKINLLPPHNYNIAGMWRFDVVLEECVIEVTAYNPKTKPGPHGSNSSVIRSKILDGLLYALEEKKPPIVVLPDSWQKKEHIQDLAKVVEKYGCHLIFTNFRNGWATQVTSEIKNIVKPQKN